MEFFKPYNEYTSDEICVLYTLYKVKQRHDFVKKMVHERKIKFVPSSKTYEILDEGLRNHLDGVTEEIRIETMTLPRRLMELFPEGSKRYNAGTIDNPRPAYKSWRGNEVVVANKLKALYVFAGRHIDDEVLVEATRRYVNSFGDDFTLMRVLPYAIIKNTSEGLKSEILDFVEAVESGSAERDNALTDWTTSVV